MKTSRSDKDPILPPELWILLPIVIIALLSGLLVGPIVEIINFFKK